MIYYIIGTNCTSACFTVAIRGGRDVKEGKHEDAYSNMVYFSIFVKPYDANYTYIIHPDDHTLEHALGMLDTNMSGCGVNNIWV